MGVSPFSKCFEDAYVSMVTKTTLSENCNNSSIDPEKQSLKPQQNTRHRFSTNGLLTSTSESKPASAKSMLNPGNHANQ